MEGQQTPLLLPPGLDPIDTTVQNLLQGLSERASATARLQSRAWSGPEPWPDWTQAQQEMGL